MVVRSNFHVVVAVFFAVSRSIFAPTRTARRVVLVLQMIFVSIFSSSSFLAFVRSSEMAVLDTPKSQSRSPKSSGTFTSTTRPAASTASARTNPLIDRILANPLLFKQASTKDTLSQSPAKGFIVLSSLHRGKKPSSSRTPESPQSTMALLTQSSATASSPRKPKSMAEAVAAYTGKKFLTRKEKRLEKLKIKQQQLELQRKLQLQLESVDDVGEEVSAAENGTTMNNSTQDEELQPHEIELDEDEDDEEEDDEDDDDDYNVSTPLLPFAKFDSESSVQISSRSTSPEKHTDSANSDGGVGVGVPEEHLAAATTTTTTDSSAGEEDSSDEDDDEDDADYAISASENDDDEDEDSSDSSSPSSRSSSSSATTTPPPDASKKRAKIGFEDDDMDIKTLKNDLKLDRYENGQDNRNLSKSVSPESVPAENEDEDDEEDEDGTSPLDQPKKLGTTPPTSPEDETEGEKLTPTTSETQDQNLVSGHILQERAKKKAQDTSLEHFYDLNQNPNDHGSNGSTRIIKHWREYSDRKPWGLLNEGVTCYMNSAIQAFVHIPAMQHYLNQIFTGKIGKEHKDKSNVTYTLAELSNSMWNPKLRVKQRPYIYPKRMIQRLHQINCMMSQWQQEDSHEYFMSLMSRLQEDLTPKGQKLNSSIIYDIFGGLLNQKITCLKCQGVSETKQEFYDLSLGLNKKKSHPYLLEKSLTDFFSNELIKTDKKDKLTGYYCNKCEMNTNANKISTIDISPEYLTIHLKRFKFDGNSLSKLKQSISYPNYLDLAKFQTQQDAELPLPLKYRLMSVIVHEGRNVTLGHYVAHCLQPDGTWATYDDEYINKIAQEQALSDPAAYVLVYGKLTAKGYKNPNQKREGSQMANGVATKKRKH